MVIYMILTYEAITAHSLPLADSSPFSPEIHRVQTQ